MSAREYLDTMYTVDNAEGKDINESHSSTNLNGYFPRIKTLNNSILAKNQLLVNAATDLTQDKAELEVASAGR